MCAALAVVLSVHALASIDESDTMVQINGHMDVTVLSTDIMDEPTFPAPYADESDVMLQIHGHTDVKVPGTDIVESAFPAPDAVIDKTEAMLQNGGHMDANTTITWMQSQIANTAITWMPNICSDEPMTLHRTPWDFIYPAPYLTDQFDCRQCNPGRPPTCREISKEQLQSGCCTLSVGHWTEMTLDRCACHMCWWDPAFTGHGRYKGAAASTDLQCRDACKQDPECYWSLLTEAFHPGCHLFNKAPEIMNWRVDASIHQFCYTKNRFATNAQCKFDLFGGSVCQAPWERGLKFDNFQHRRRGNGRRHSERWRRRRSFSW